MPKGKGTYGSKKGRPPKKPRKPMKPKKGNKEWLNEVYTQTYTLNVLE